MGEAGREDRAGQGEGAGHHKVGTVLGVQHRHPHTHAYTHTFEGEPALPWAVQGCVWRAWHTPADMVVGCTLRGQNTGLGPPAAGSITWSEE
jgi:hypothetical protein